jgi:KilA-N domain
MAKQTIIVQGIEVRLQKTAHGDFICLSDIAKVVDQPTSYTLRNWLRNRATVDFLGVWEAAYNPVFNSVEFDAIRMESGSNAFAIAAGDWVEKTSAIGLNSTAGRYGGTFAHFDIAIHFCNWLSPAFYVYLVKQFRQLKESEAARLGEQWDLRRELAKGNYFIHTDAVRTNLVPVLDWNTKREGLYFASEADLLNLAVFGTTAKQFKALNPDAKGNLRDTASTKELQVLANMESINATLIEQGFTKEERLSILTRRAERELTVLEEVKALQEVKKLELRDKNPRK